MSATIRHSDACTMTFGRKSAAGVCPRCDELRDGAPARAGWGDAAKARERATLASIARHFAPGSPHARGACGPVCTFGDW